MLSDVAALCVVVLQLLLQLLLHAAAVRHRVPDGKICCCGSLHMIPVFSFSSSFKHDVFLMYCHICSLDLPIIRIIHPQQLRVCAGPRRASARRGEGPLVYIYAVSTQAFHTYLLCDCCCTVAVRARSTHTTHTYMHTS